MELVVLHPAVASRWWLQHLPDSKRPSGLLDRSAAGDFGFVAPDTLESETLSALVDDLQFETPPLADEIATMLSGDVQGTFALLITTGRLRLVAHSSLHTTAFGFALRHRIGLSTAMYIVIALSNDARLAVASDGLRRIVAELNGAGVPIRSLDLGDTQSPL